MALSRRTRQLLGIPVGAVAGLAVIALTSTSLGPRMEALALDARFRSRGELPLDERIVLVDIDEETVELLGYPLPRGFYGQLIEIARKHGARAVGFDILFFDKSEDAAMDTLFAKAAADCRCAVIPSQLSPVVTQAGAVSSDLRVESPLPQLSSSAAAPAHVQLENDVDGTFRSLDLTMQTRDATFASLSLATARVAGAPVTQRAATLDEAYINWRTASSQGARALRFIDVLGAADAGDAALLGRFRDSIVIVGQTAKSIGDRGATPLSSDAPLVLAHVNMLDNLLHDRVLAPPSTALTVLFALACALLCGFAATALRAWKAALAALALLGALWIGAFLAFNADVWLPLAAPSAAAALAFVAGAVVNVQLRDADEQRLRQAFERWVAPHILDRILQSPDSVDIRGHRRTLTLMFSDIKGYTTLSNTLSPEEIVELLCTYLDAMVEILMKHEGTVDKMMGDGIMAFFGDPLPQNDHALRCVRAALEMQRASAVLGESWTARGHAALQVRIGIATGEVFVGSIGSRGHLEYTAIGRPVNLASRLEGKSPPGGVLVSGETWALVKDHVVGREVRGLDLKGYVAGYDAWLVTGLVGEDAAAAGALEQRVGARQPFFSDVVMRYGDQDLQARSSDISPGGMFVHCDVLPPLGATVRVHAALRTQPGGAATSTVHMDAVVTHVRDGDAPGAVARGGVGLMFTSVFADDRNAIQALLEGVLGVDAFEEQRVVSTSPTSPAAVSGEGASAVPQAAPARYAYQLDVARTRGDAD